MTLYDLHLLPVGLVVGFVASIVGVGGGFFVVPYLMLVYDPEKFDPVHAAATSLAIVLLTSTSSTVANVRRKRIDYRLAIAFAAGTLPGALLGPHLLPSVTPKAFQIGFAVLLFATAGYLLFFRAGPKKGGDRSLVEADGTEHRYQANLPLGFGVSLLAGFVASMGGVGGGILHMPLLVLVFSMTPHIASATSQLILMITAAVGTGTYALQGNIDGVAFLLLGAGVVVGAQIGVRSAKKIPSAWIKRALAVVVILVAVQMALRGLGVLNPL